MCGVAGIVGLEDGGVLLNKMLDSQRHRGPDAEGRHVERGIALGMRRLSIIDVAGGDQPCLTADRSVMVFMNGEIYNHGSLRKEFDEFPYASQTDTEVIPHLWQKFGEDSLDKLAGMFSLAIWEPSKKTLTLVRDRMGIKPLWIYEDQGILSWSSEIKSFAQAGLSLKLNPQGLWDYMTHGYIPSPDCPFKNVRALLPGHLLRIQLDDKNKWKSEDHCYWALPEADWADPAPSAAVGYVKELLQRSMEEHLKSDVPLGCLLSGGLDSGLLTAWASKIRGAPISTFSVGFAESSYDERGEALALAKELGCSHHSVELREADFLIHLDTAMARTDTLLADPAMVALVPLYDLVQKHVTVVLDGDGADELFGGYPTVTADTIHSLITCLPAYVRRQLKELSRVLPQTKNKANFFFKCERLLRNADLEGGQAHTLWRNIHRLEDKEFLIHSDYIPQSFEEKLGIKNHLASFVKAGGNYTHRDFTKNDLKIWLPDDNLKKVDGQSMGVSVEARVPFLDHRLVELVYPMSLKLKRKFGVKGLLREAGRGILPSSYLNRKKASFHLPLAAWTTGHLKLDITNRIMHLNELSQGFFKEDALRKFIDQSRGDAYSIFNLLALESWWKQWPTTLSI